MRPIERGELPRDAQGNYIQFNNYQESRGHLLNRFGSYCSYCERALGGDIAVEHIQPKIHAPDLVLEWTNFLLACKNCNSIKKDKDISLNEYYWSDTHNTFKAFNYNNEGLIIVNELLSEPQKAKANQTMLLTGLNRTPDINPLNNPEKRDRRWEERLTAWGKANRAKLRLEYNNTDEMREQIIETAVATGYWSIWVTVFAGNMNMMDRLITAFPGTCTNCFDENKQPLDRVAGEL